jgi:hypothetical protein
LNNERIHLIGRQEEAKTKPLPANSILAIAATAWDLDVAHKEAEADAEEEDFG